ncbi:MAG: PstS family phosphate ABC transporter substrate-binding protein [Xanthomonadales bacterium]|nr:PstS family phosphate ABC transporter substrate-binding protein [Xanthomonadales bacterium]
MLKPNTLILTSALLATAFLLVACGGQDRQVIQNKGSDTLVNVAQAWAEAYQKIDPKTVVAVSGGGSGTGIAALINGTVDIANSSRAMKDKEVKLAKDRGHDPIRHVVGYDALAVYLHPNNPLDEISIPQLAEIYGDGGSYSKWTDLGVEVPGCKNQEIVVISRQNNSGTYAYFRKVILGVDDFRLGTRDLHGSKDVAELVEKTPCAIGYSGLAYVTDHLKVACVAQQTGGECTSPTVTTASNGSYPIARPLFMYTSGEPEGYVGEYLSWIKSNEGQCIIVNKGYAPASEVSC